MSGVGRQGDAVLRDLGPHDAPSPDAQTLRRSRIGTTGMACGSDGIGITAQAHAADESHHESCTRGERSRAAGSLRIVNLDAEYSAAVTCAQQTVCFYIPRVAFREFFDERGNRVIDLNCPPGTIDPVMAHLAQALLPAFEQAIEPASRFVDHIALAVLAHLAHRYGGLEPRHPAMRGGLSILQERRAKDYLTANAGRDILLAEVARACGLSRARFISGFARTTGLTPHRWLQAYRLQQVRTLLLTSAMATAEIALRCGFADQSHMSRVFKRHLGTSPVAWRRQHQQRHPIDLSATDRSRSGGAR